MVTSIPGPTWPRFDAWLKAWAPRSTWSSRWAVISTIYSAWWMPMSISACTASSAVCCVNHWTNRICRRRSDCTVRPSSCASSANCWSWIRNRSSSGKSTRRSSRCGTCGVPSRRISSARRALPSSPTRPMPAVSGISWKTRWVCPVTLPFRVTPV